MRDEYTSSKYDTRMTLYLEICAAIINAHILIMSIIELHFFLNDFHHEKHYDTLT
jgi:hypothetical protein